MPTWAYSSHISCGGICIAILTVPTLLDFWITWATVSTPWGSWSLTVLPGTCSQPGPVSMGVSARTRPVSSAHAAMKGFIVEPGSKMSVSARLRNCSPLRLRRRLTS